MGLLFLRLTGNIVLKDVPDHVTDSHIESAVRSYFMKKYGKKSIRRNLKIVKIERFRGEWVPILRTVYVEVEFSHQPKNPRIEL